MSPTPSIPPLPPASKDPPSAPSSPPPTSQLRTPSFQETTDSHSMPPPPRPTVNTRLASFDPQRHILSPSPLLEVTTASQSLSTPNPQTANSESQQPQQQQRFTPFFTLVNDTSTQSTYHPSRVHYIFSDDDASELLTSSLLKQAQASNGNNGKDSQVDLSRGSLEHISSRGGTGTTSSSSSATFRKAKERENEQGAGAGAKKEREERVLIVDINHTLDGISRISSLSAEWQVLSASIERAPSFDPTTGGGEDGDEGDEKGLMLKIDGVGVESFRDVDGEEGVKGLGLQSSGSGQLGLKEEEMQSLLEGFDRKMAVLRKVVGSSGVEGKDREI